MTDMIVCAENQGSSKCCLIAQLRGLLGQWTATYICHVVTQKTNTAFQAFKV